MPTKKNTVVEIRNWLTDEVIATGEAGETLTDVVIKTINQARRK